MNEQHVLMPYHGTELKRGKSQELRAEKVATQEEAIVWSRLRHNRLRGAHFRRQHVIDGFIVDFYCHAAQLVVEIDGSVHNSADQMLYDTERDSILADRGLLVLRFTNAQVRTGLKAVMLRIAQAVTSRSTPRYER